MNLETLQTVFTQALDPASNDDAREVAAQLLHVGGELQPLDRLRVYQHNVSGVHQRAMEMIFPVCQQILGDLTFATLCKGYSWAEPTANPDLNQYAELFPGYLAAQIMRRESLHGYEYLGDLSYLEYLWHRAYYAADDSSFDFAGFSRSQAEGKDVAFDLANSLSLLQSDYPIMEIWQQHKKGEASDLVQGLSHRQCLIVYRQDLEAHIAELTRNQFMLLKGCQQGKSVVLLADDSETNEALGSLPNMIDKGWITGFHHV